jgi:hypothetical protein
LWLFLALPITGIGSEHRMVTPQPERAGPAFAIILLLALAARLLVVCFVLTHYPPGWLYARGIELGLLAQSLVAGHGLSSPFGGATGPTALLTPAYPVLMACIFRLLGSFTRASAIAIMTMQLGFNLLTVWVMMRAARQCFGATAAHVAGFIWALSLPLIWMPTIFWETCLSTLLLTGMAPFCLRLAARPHAFLWIATGACCGLAALVNPALLLPLLAMLGWAGWQGRTQPGAITPRGRLILPLVPLLILAPWPIRNAHVLHAWIPLRSTVGLELWMGNRPGANGFLDPSIFPLFNRSEFAQYATEGEVRYMRDKTASAYASIEARPGAFVRLTAVRVARFWSGTGTEHGSAWFPFHAMLTTSLGSLGLLQLWRRGRSALATLFLLPLLLFPLPYYLTHAEFRYRLVIDPLLTMLSGAVIAGFAGRVKA